LINFSLPSTKSLIKIIPFSKLRVMICKSFGKIILSTLSTVQNKSEDMLRNSNRTIKETEKEKGSNELKRVSK